MEEELMGPKSIEEDEYEPTETVEEREMRSGQPGSYTGPETRCAFCVHFREFSSPACRRFKFEADPEGYCDDFEGRKEDSSGTTEESYGNMGDEEEDEAEDEE